MENQKQPDWAWSSFQKERSQLIVPLLVFITIISMFLFGTGDRTNASQSQPALRQESPDTKKEAYYKDEYNSKGEMHSRLIVSHGLQGFVLNNCDEATASIYTQIVKASYIADVKPEIVFAIAWADTQCGKYLTTPNNYGNVNNNDRGNRVGYFTPLEGYQAIVDTLNNKYIGQNYRVGHLTGGGRKALNAEHGCQTAPMGWKCYATSEINHVKNTLRALRVMMNDESIDENYEFRI